MTIHLPSETAMALAMALTDARFDLHAKRVAAEAAIEDLINFLDDTQDDPDLEENGDERDSSWPTVGPHAFGAAIHEGDEDDDPGEESDFGEDGADDEPSISTIGHYHNGKMLHDLELDTSDDEPTLGSPDHLTPRDQEHWSQGDCYYGDMEETNEDGGNILDEPHDWDDDREPDLTFNFGTAGASVDFEGPRDSESKDQRDRPAASRLHARAMRMANAKAVA